MTNQTFVLTLDILIKNRCFLKLPLTHTHRHTDHSLTTMRKGMLLQWNDLVYNTLVMKLIPSVTIDFDHILSGEIQWRIHSNAEVKFSPEHV